MIHQEYLQRYHAAAKIIEYDGAEGYHTCVERHGVEVANFLLIAFLRHVAGSKNTFPTPEDIPEKVSKMLIEYNLLKGD